MNETDQFVKNLERWSVFSPSTADKLKKIKCSHTSLCQASNGEPNLQVTRGEQTFFLHSTENPSKEAKDQFDQLSLGNVSTIYVFGLGLGYLYDAIWSWLRKNPQRNLVILEDDIEILYHFLHTERAMPMLYDRQVFVSYVGMEDPAYNEFDKFLANFALSEYSFTQLNSYAKYRALDTASFRGRLSFFLVMNRFNTSEYNNYGMTIFNNYFKDMLLLPSVHYGNGLYDKFKGIPAIICGAGPSLEKNIDQLIALKDRALIFTGGTGLNALDTHHLNPHFAVGIDPNPEQFTRLVMQQSYVSPFFYRNRINNEALNIIHNDKLYLTGSGGYFTSKWFEKKLGIEGKDVNEGFNVLNFSLSIAHALGCNPIIFVGIDLAYTAGHSYMPGIISHPIHDRKSSFRTKTSQDELLVKEDIYGEPVHTLWKWMAESVWYTQYAKDNPDLKMINCTEGGIGFPNIINMKLKDAAHIYLEKTYDIDTLVHGAMQSAHFPKKIQASDMKKIMSELGEELLKCWEICHRIFLELQGMLVKADQSFEEPDQKKIEEVEKMVADLKKEPGYENFLNVFNDSFSKVWGAEYLRLKFDKEIAPVREIQTNAMRLDSMRYNYLKQTALMNSSLIRDILQTDEDEQVKMSELPKTEITLPKDVEIIPLLEEPLKGTSERTYYANGQLKTECYYLDGKLHGPSSCYAEDGQPLAKSWFIHGLQQGKKKTYYANGALHSIQNFKDGKFHGPQEYFYPDGMTKSLLPYIDGLFHGFLYLYHPNGLLARTNHYEKGKRHGIEKIWDKTGSLMMEAEYIEDEAVGTARQWYPNGVLAKLVKFDKKTKGCVVQRWNEMGIAVEGEQLFGDDYFDRVTKLTAKLTDSLSQVFEQFSRLTSIINTKVEGNQSFPVSVEEMHGIKQKLELMQKLNQELNVESGLDADNPMEALWKSPSIQKDIEKKLEVLNEQMSQEIKRIELAMNKIIRSMGKV